MGSPGEASGGSHVGMHGAGLTQLMVALQVVEAQVALSRSFGCHIFMASGQSAASALQAVLPGPEGRSARVVVSANTPAMQFATTL